MTPTSPAEVFELELAILPSDIDALQHVNNVVYLRWVQDLATAHWRAAASPEQQARLAWVVARHEIDYRQPARLGESLTGRTWVGAARGRLFERHCEIVRRSDGRVLARALTLWCPIDPQTGRATTVDADVRARFSVTTPVTGEGE